MKRKLILWVSLFIGGYLTANRGLPKGEEFLMFESIAWIGGMYAGVLLMKFYNNMKSRPKENKPFRIFGYELRVNKSVTKQVAPFVRLVKPESNANRESVASMEGVTENAPSMLICDFCQGDEDIRLSGQKIDCPKCKGNSEAKAL